MTRELKQQRKAEALVKSTLKASTDFIFIDVDTGKPTRVRTQYVYPPIPVRSHDWQAWDDNLGADCSPIGEGATEQEAITNFLEQI